MGNGSRLNLAEPDSCRASEPGPLDPRGAVRPQPNHTLGSSSEGPYHSAISDTPGGRRIARAAAFGHSTRWSWVRRVLVGACWRCGGAVAPDQESDYYCLICGRPYRPGSTYRDPLPLVTPGAAR